MEKFVHNKCVMCPYSVGSVWHAPVAPEGVFCGRRFRWRCGSEVGFDERDGDSIGRGEVPILVLEMMSDALLCFPNLGMTCFRFYKEDGRWLPP